MKPTRCSSKSATSKSADAVLICSLVRLNPRYRLVHPCWPIKGSRLIQMVVWLA